MSTIGTLTAYIELNAQRFRKQSDEAEIALSNLAAKCENAGISAEKFGKTLENAVGAKVRAEARATIKEIEMLEAAGARFNAKAKRWADSSGFIATGSGSMKDASDRVKVLQDWDKAIIENRSRTLSRLVEMEKTHDQALLMNQKINLSNKLQAMKNLETMTLASTSRANEIRTKSEKDYQNLTSSLRAQETEGIKQSMLQRERDQAAFWLRKMKEEQSLSKQHLSETYAAQMAHMKQVNDMKKSKLNEQANYWLAHYKYTSALHKESSNEFIRFLNEMSHKFTNRVKFMIAQWTAFAAIMIPTAGVAAFFTYTFKAVDDLKTDIASLAAVTMTFSKMNPGETAAEHYKRAHKYASAMVPVLEQIAAKTLLSGRETTMLATEFAKAGVFLDANNKKAIEGFESFSNALAVLTKGQATEKQVLTEVRAMMGMGNAAGAVMLKTLEKIDVQFKENIKTAIKNGTVYEYLRDLLIGFGMATSEWATTWKAVSTALETTIIQILRLGGEGIYNEIMKELSNLNDYLVKHREEIGKSLVAVWKTVSKAIKDVWEILGTVYSIISNIIELLPKFETIIKAISAVIAYNFILKWVSAIAIVTEFLGIMGTLKVAVAAVGTTFASWLPILVIISAHKVWEWLSGREEIKLQKGIDDAVNSLKGLSEETRKTKLEVLQLEQVMLFEKMKQIEKNETPFQKILKAYKDLSGTVGKDAIVLFLEKFKTKGEEASESMKKLLAQIEELVKTERIETPKGLQNIDEEITKETKDMEKHLKRWDKTFEELEHKVEDFDSTLTKNEKKIMDWGKTIQDIFDQIADDDKLTEFMKSEYMDKLADYAVEGARKLYEKFEIESIAANEKFQKKLFTEQQKRLISTLEQEKKIVEETIKEWNAYRDSLVKNYDDLIAKANEFYAAADKARDVATKGQEAFDKQFGPKLSAQDQMLKERETLEKLMKSALYSNDIAAIENAMAKAQEFTSKYASMAEQFGNLGILNSVKELWQSLISKANSLGNEYERNGNAVMKMAEQQLKAIGEVDWAIYNLELRVIELDGLIAKAKSIDINTTRAEEQLNGLINLVNSLSQAIAGMPALNVGGGTNSGVNGPTGTVGEDSEGKEYVYDSEGNVVPLAKGTDYVPKTGFYQLHEGEAVIPKEYNKNGTKGDVNININGYNKDPKVLAKEIVELINTKRVVWAS